MISKEDKIAKNIQDFFNTHGVKGFFTLYLYRVFLRMVRSSIHSRNPNRKSDVEYNYFFGEDGSLRHPSELEEADQQLENYCLAKAKQIVVKLDKEGFFDDIQEDREEIMDTLVKLNRKLQRVLKAELGVRWGENG